MHSKCMRPLSHNIENKVDGGIGQSLSKATDNDGTQIIDIPLLRNSPANNHR